VGRDVRGGFSCTVSSLGIHIVSGMFRRISVVFRARCNKKHLVINFIFWMIGCIILSEFFSVAATA
jgi:hypothetical protein